MDDNRRDFLKKGALLGLAGLAGNLMSNSGLSNFTDPSYILPPEGGKFTLPQLPYAYDALEPVIDKQTMEIHHTKHHQAYIDKLNTVADKLDPALDVAGNCKKIDGNSTPLLRNNLGGHYNHSLFWTLLVPNKENKDLKPIGGSADAIAKNFKSFDNFQKEFTEKATKIFGSGWCWLILDDQKNLKVVTSPNQDNPLMSTAAERGTPLLALDVWEHAYYLKYQNKRADYISNWWKIVNWQKVEELYSAV